MPIELPNIPEKRYIPTANTTDSGEVFFDDTPKPENPGEFDEHWVRPEHELKFVFSKELLVDLYRPFSIPTDFNLLPHILSRESLAPVAQSPNKGELTEEVGQQMSSHCRCH